MASVSDLLNQAWTSHTAYRSAVRRKDQVGAKAALQAALDARTEAELLNPARDDDAWKLEGSRTTRGTDTHAAMMAFYEEQLGKRS